MPRTHTENNQEINNIQGVTVGPPQPAHSTSSIKTSARRKHSSTSSSSSLLNGSSTSSSRVMTDERRMAKRTEIIAAFEELAKSAEQQDKIINNLGSLKSIIAAADALIIDCETFREELATFTKPTNTSARLITEEIGDTYYHAAAALSCKIGAMDYFFNLPDNSNLTIGQLKVKYADALKQLPADFNFDTTIANAINFCKKAMSRFDDQENRKQIAEVAHQINLYNNYGIGQLLSDHHTSKPLDPMFAEYVRKNKTKKAKRSTHSVNATATKPKPMTTSSSSSSTAVSTSSMSSSAAIINHLDDDKSLSSAEESESDDDEDLIDTNSLEDFAPSVTSINSLMPILKYRYVSKDSLTLAEEKFNEILRNIRAVKADHEKTQERFTQLQKEMGVRVFTGGLKKYALPKKAFGTVLKIPFDQSVAEHLKYYSEEIKKADNSKAKLKVTAKKFLELIEVSEDLEEHLPIMQSLCEKIHSNNSSVLSELLDEIIAEKSIRVTTATAEDDEIAQEKINILQRFKQEPSMSDTSISTDKNIASNAATSSTSSSSSIKPINMVNTEVFTDIEAGELNWDGSSNNSTTISTTQPAERASLLSMPVDYGAPSMPATMPFVSPFAESSTSVNSVSSGGATIYSDFSSEPFAATVTTASTTPTALPFSLPSPPVIGQLVPAPLPSQPPTSKKLTYQFQITNEESINRCRLQFPSADIDQDKSFGIVCSISHAIKPTSSVSSYQKAHCRDEVDLFPRYQFSTLTRHSEYFVKNNNIPHKIILRPVNTNTKIYVIVGDTGNDLAVHLSYQKQYEIMIESTHSIPVKHRCAYLHMQREGRIKDSVTESIVVEEDILFSSPASSTESTSSSSSSSSIVTQSNHNPMSATTATVSSLTPTSPVSSTGGIPQKRPRESILAKHSLMPLPSDDESVAKRPKLNDAKVTTHSSSPAP
ncbi:hypothetical protein AYO45_00385 [Gammaproteobacteria bacterium SCGC AG-212-F23]|nr:hypothetical protein AYO45_00385 [Gammaproteobacteria bacterium SCGC AG-212-F23]